MTLAIICGMEAEAVALGRWRADPRTSVTVTAGRPARTETEAERLVRSGARILLSWGIGGGLDPVLPPGALIVPDGVIGPGGRPFAFDAALVSACRDALAGTSPACGYSHPPGSPGIAGSLLLAGSDAVLASPAAKAALRRRSGAAAVDMESHWVASAARRARVPALAVRAVSDPAGRRLPVLVTAALDDSGRPRFGPILAGVARRPWDLPALLAARRDSRAALAALTAAADAILPALLASLDGEVARSSRAGPARQNRNGRQQAEGRH